MAGFFFFFNDTATTEIYTLSLHDALPISWRIHLRSSQVTTDCSSATVTSAYRDRKSTRLNSSHSQISYAVFCLKKKKTDDLAVRTGWRAHVSELHPAPGCPLAIHWPLADD